MPSLLQGAYRALKSKMSKRGAAKSALGDSVTPIESAWSKMRIIISIFNNMHLCVVGNPPVLTLVSGTGQLEKETFTIASRAVEKKDSITTVCYFSHRCDDVTYYITARDGNVVLQSFKTEPDLYSQDGRLFVLSTNKTWCQFQSFGSNELFLCHDSTGFCLKRQTDKDRSPFNFDLIEVNNT